MAKKKQQWRRGKVELGMDFMKVVTELEPFQHQDTNEVFLVNKIKDESGQVQRKKEFPLNSQDGKDLVRAVATEVLEERTAREDEVKEIIQLARVLAMRKPPRLPETPAARLRDRERSARLNEALKVLEFHLDTRGQLVVRFAGDDTGPDFKLKDHVIQAELHGILVNGGSEASPLEMGELTFECVREASRRYRSIPNAERYDASLDENSLVHAVVKRAVKLYHEEKKTELELSPTDLRNDLLAGVKDEFPRADQEWPENAEFTKRLKDRLAGPLGVFGVKVEQGGRSGMRRSLILKIMDPAKLPRYVKEEHAEMENTPSKDSGRQGSDAGDAPNGQVASQPSNGEPPMLQGDSQMSQQPPQPTGRSKHVTERVGDLQAAQELLEPSSEELPQQ